MSDPEVDHIHLHRTMALASPGTAMPVEVWFTAGLSSEDAASARAWTPEERKILAAQWKSESARLIDDLLQGLTKTSAAR